MQLRVEKLTKYFGPRRIFADLDLTLARGAMLAVTGRNGSGKSTFLRIIAGAMEPTGGAAAWRLGESDLDRNELGRHLGYVAPYLNLYPEFSAWEHAEMLQGMRDLPFDAARARALFERFDLADRRHDRIGTFSSGMAQRAKFVCALIHRPSFLLLDEPMSNLDTAGIAAMRAAVAEDAADRITVIATNEEEDVRVCTGTLSVESEV